MEKIKILWDKIPKEIKVAIYLAISKAVGGFFDGLLEGLKGIQLNDALSMAIVNVLIVLIVHRTPQIVERLRKK